MRRSLYKPKKALRPRLDARLPEEQGYRSLFQNHHTVMLLIDPHTGKIVEANPAACAYYGYTREELLNLRITDINTLSGEATRAEMARAKAFNRNHFLFSHRLASGEVRPVEVFSGPIQFNGQQILYSIVHDISDRRQAEQSLSRELEVNAALAKLSKALISSAPIETISDLVLESAQQLTGSRFGYVGYLDPLTGSLVSPTLTREIWDICGVDDKTVLFKKYAGLWGWVLENQEPVMANTVPADPRSSGTPAGHIPIQKFLSVPAMVGSQLLGQLALANPDDDYTQQDLEVTERLADLYALAIQRKLVEKELREERDFNTAVLDTAGALVIVLDREGRIVRFNRACEQSTGYTFAEVKGKPFWDFLLLPEEMDAVKEVFYSLWAGEFPKFFENYWVTKTGERRSITWANTILLDVEGFPQHIIATGIDITEHRQVEKEALKRQLEIDLHHRLMDHWEMERLRIAQELHDGPIQELYGILFNLEAEQNTSPTQAGRSRLDAIREVVEQQIQEMRVLCNDLRPPTLTRFGLERAIRSHVETFEAKHPNLKIELDLQPDGQQLSEPVRLALFRIQQELLNNVVKHSQASRVVVQLKVEPGSAELTLQDNGRGFQIPGEWMELAYQGHLGLVGIRERASAVNGSLRIDSQPGLGTTVRVQVPLSSS